MRSESLRVAIVALALGLLAPGCGPKPAVSTGRTDCETRCDLQVMGCLEDRVCLDPTGQKIPCMEECQTDLAACEQACGGR
jgi:hypothetical protein